jgi:glycosyltransferase involved in cell wall biosynthesis
MQKYKLSQDFAEQLIAERSEKTPSSEAAQKPYVSVCFLTYNHMEFIEQALDSVLMQETKFPFEIVIGDDASSDGASEIIDQYQRQHPNKIKILRSTENLGKYTGNGRINLIRNLSACRGKYIAFLEGDDYWLSSKKLQLQVEALDANAQYSSSFHDTHIKMHDEPNVMKPWRDFTNVTSMNLSEIIAPLSPFHTSSFMARRSCLDSLPSYFLHSQSGDLILFIAAAVHGGAVKVDDVFSVYRKHPGGVTNNQSHRGASIQKARIDMHKALRKYYLVNSQIDSQLFNRVIKIHHDRLKKINKKKYSFRHFMRRYILKISSYSS